MTLFSEKVLISNRCIVQRDQKILDGPYFWCHTTVDYDVWISEPKFWKESSVRHDAGESSILELDFSCGVFILGTLSLVCVTNFEISILYT